VSEALDVATQRQLAVDLFNRTWKLLERPDRTQAEDDEMLHCAHASRYHWIGAGTQVNAARGEWQCSRVYAVLGRGEPALHHAKRCLELAETAHDAAPWDIPFAYEALARAYAVAGDEDEARRWLDRAREAADAIEKEGDKNLLLSDLETVPL
jgi:lipopolysaccharide biosynthesis regulator YciM